MVTKSKLLWCGDAVIPTGFGRVTHSVLDPLYGKYEISVIGINYRGDPHDYKYKIYPAFLGGDLYGVGRLGDVARESKPDIICMLNDPIILDRYVDVVAGLEKRPKVVVYFPIDSNNIYSDWFTKFPETVDAVCVYTQFGYDEFIKSCPEYPKEKIYIIPHGIDMTKFFPIDRQEAKSTLYPEEKRQEMLNSFIVFNGNRNQPRKRIDLTMVAFKEFSKNKDDVKLYLHMGSQDAGVNLVKKAIQMDFDHKLILSDLGAGTPNVPVQRLNLIYNATDIGINTSTGEGWGLVNWEQGACKVPQIVPDHSACREIWKDRGFLIPTLQPEFHLGMDTEGQVIGVKYLVDILNAAYHDWKSGGAILNEYADRAYEHITKEEFSWDNVAKQFAEVFEKVLNA